MSGSRQVGAIGFICFGLIIFNPGLYSQETQVIKSIVVRNRNVFDLEKENLPFFPYGLINKLHITTREGIIRRELLFKPGSILNKRIVKETERRLRDFPFIRVAEISLRDDKDGAVADVYTQDSWTTEPQASVGGGGGEYRYSFGVEEKNFLGLGKDVGAFYERDEEKNISKQIFYNDPHFLPGYWRLESFFLRSEDGSMDNIKLFRPYYKLDTHWSADARWDRNNIEENIYKCNETAGSYNHYHYRSEAVGSVKIFSDNESAYRIGAGYLYEDNKFYDLSSAVISAAPRDYALKAPEICFQCEKYDYIETRDINSFVRVEDYNFGNCIEVKYGYSSASSGAGPDSSVFSMKNEKGFLFGKDNFLLTKLEARGVYRESKPRNVLTEARINYYNKIFDKQTFAFNAAGILGKNLDWHEQIILGGMNGLRGYPAREFTGVKSILVNVEERFFWIDEFLSLAGIGGVVFFDSGYVWGRGEPIRAGDMKSDIGAGLRLALTRSSEGLVVRLDFAYALDKIRDENRFVISFGSKQSF